MRQEFSDQLKALIREKNAGFWKDGWVYGRLRQEFDLQPDELEALATALKFKRGWNPVLEEILQKQWLEDEPRWMQQEQENATLSAVQEWDGGVPTTYTTNSNRQMIVGTGLALSNPIISATASAIGIAKTGTAIGTLHGAAHTSATAAWIGFGSMKFGMFMMGALPVVGALLILDGICGRDHGIPLIDWHEEFWKRYELQRELEDLKKRVNVDEDIEKVLDQALSDMQQRLVQMRQAVVSAIAAQKRTQQQLNQSQTEANTWKQRAQLALQKGDENCAREALVRQKAHIGTAKALQSQLDHQATTVDTLKRNLVAWEGKISEAKTKKDMLVARAAAAKANEKLQSTVANMNISSSMAAFEQMEKVLQMEARSQAVAEFAGADLEIIQLATIESGGNVDVELEAMKAQLLGGSFPAQAQLHSTETASVSGSTSISSTTPAQDVAIDNELEALKTKLDQL